MVQSVTVDLQSVRVKVDGLSSPPTKRRKHSQGEGGGGGQHKRTPDVTSNTNTTLVLNQTPLMKQTPRSPIASYSLLPLPPSE